MLTSFPVLANVPGGGTGTGPNVTLTDNGSTVVISNGIVSILCTKSGGSINQINYTYNNGGGTQTINLLSGGNNGGQLYWENSTSQSLSFTYSLVADPASNGGDYAEISLVTTSVANDVLEVHYSLLRGSTGFYVTAIYAHRSIDGAFSMGECRDNIYAGSIFNWMSVDATRNRLMQVSGGSSIGVQGAPVEVSLWTNGIYAGQYEDKYKYSADLGVQRVWGWSSVGTGGKNVGLWNISASGEYYNGGPLKPELMEHIGTTILNMLNGSHYGMGTDGSFAAGEVWAKVCGPYFIYCNNVSNGLTATNQAAQALYNDALAQGEAELTAWPYSWFTNASYSSAANRGTVTGQFVIDDSGNPNASASGLWVGLVQQPSTATGTYDFQQWMKPYQFWVKTDADGNFTIPNVIAGSGYTLYAFGPGAPGTFMSSSQIGGDPPLLFDLPAVPFNVAVTEGGTNNLGSITWTPDRVGATVFEIGSPDHTSAEFRHGDDWWVGDIGPNPNAPSPIWSKWLELPFDFPSGVNYVVGEHRWTTDWNYVQPVLVSDTGTYNNSSSTITFNLPTAPTNEAAASLYLGLASDYYAAIIVTVNGVNLGSIGSVIGLPNNSIPTTGYYPGYSHSDSTIREGNHAAFSDERLNFPASLLHAGTNTITIGIRQIGGSYFADHAMYDYIRLEFTGYVPPPPASVMAYAGNNCNLVAWPVTPGATSYNVLRSTTPVGGFVSVTNGVTGPVCGSGWNSATYLDATALNGTTYYYQVQSANPGGASTNSPASSGATPSGAISTSPPMAPTGMSVGSVGHHSVPLNWNASPGAAFYTIYRSTLVSSGGGSSNVLSTIVLNNNTTGTSYTDTSPTDGSIYSYFVTASSAGGTSGNSASAVGIPLPAPPASAPGSLTGQFNQSGDVDLDWSAVTDAVGYVVRRATSVGGPYIYLQTITETTYTDGGVTPGTYYYQVAAMNAGGVSANAAVTVIALPTAPASLSAVAGNTLVTLSWSSVANATGYFLYRGTSSNSINTIVVPNYAGTSYTNTGLVNGTTYYYVVAGTNAGGLGPNSPVASATPSAVVAGPQDLTWRGDGSANVWDLSGATNWRTNGVATVFNNADSVTFDNSGSNNVSVALTGTLQPSLVTFNASKNYTFGGSGTLSGTNALIKNNSGTLTLSATDSYTGGTVVNSGRLTFSVGAAIPSSGMLTLNNTGAVTVVTANSLPNVLVNGNNAITGNGNSGTGIATLDVEGALTLFVSGGSRVFDLTGSMTGPGSLTLGGAPMTLRFNGTSGDANAIFDLGTGANFGSVRNNTSSIRLGGLAGGSATTLQGAGSFNTAVTFTIGGASTDAQFDGVIVNGSFSGNPAVSIVKTGANKQTFTKANTYTGGTTVNGGVLLLKNTSGSGTGTGSVTVNSSGTLGGDGIVTGAVMVNSGAGLAPGDPIGTFSIANSLTLANGSTTYVQIRHSPLANDAVNATGALTLGGTLNVTDAGAGGFTAGDTFQLFSAGSYAGAFNDYVLPSLSGGLVWNTNTVKVSGALSVVALTPPAISGLNLSGGNISISGTGGAPYWPYYLLATTNLSLPMPQWTRVATNQCDAAGNFSLNLAVNPNWPQTFYRVQLQ